MTQWSVVHTKTNFHLVVLKLVMLQPIASILVTRSPVLTLTRTRTIPCKTASCVHLDIDFRIAAPAGATTSTVSCVVLLCIVSLVFKPPHRKHVYPMANPFLIARLTLWLHPIAGNTTDTHAHINLHPSTKNYKERLTKPSSSGSNEHTSIRCAR